jgi:general secretion pathway protein G
MAVKLTIRYASLVFLVVLIAAFSGCSTPAAMDRKSKEILLKSDLKEMRKLIDQYAADHSALPASLDDLVNDGYMREIPIDPLTGNRDWEIEIGEDGNYHSGRSGMVDVHSKAAGKDSQGTPYSEY